ncbi:tetratricopeptide repeat protein 29 isoform X2 [Brienomyrus brachyistius]|uniref:tetratricopeptide repeat protein 29 isoform X2 n=1 Tax=Brienomyrus brachyistius TaxID=42636 RepID=UPI0020B2DA12|nr:tetratricopeptide repeat protein 29 isoform X2 [Brienomyrus brachyistius]
MRSSVVPRLNVSFLPDIRSGCGRKGRAAPARRPCKDEGESGSSDEGNESSAGPIPSRDQTSRFRNSLKQNICIDMLRKGYHRSFREIFALIQKQAASGEAPGPGSGIWQPRPLEERPHKLEQIQRFLTRAEEAQRAGCYEEVYDNQVVLARYFEDQEDKWLSDYFYEVCLDSAQRIKMDGGEREAEANFNMGRIYMEQGRLEAAVECATASRRLAAGRTWTDGVGRSCCARTCQSLSTIYSSLAKKMLENEEHQVAIETLLKALEMAKEAGDKKIEAEAAYRLGSAYRLVQDHQAARRYLKVHVEICTALGDLDHLGDTYTAVAESLQSEGKHDEAIQYLLEFAEASAGNSQRGSLGVVYLYLGTIFISNPLKSRSEAGLCTSLSFRARMTGPARCS